MYTLDFFATQYLDYYMPGAGYTISTINSYRVRLRRFCRFVGGSIDITKITSVLVEQYENELRTGASDTGVFSYMCTIKQFFTYLKHKREIDCLDPEKIPVPKLKSRPACRSTIDIDKLFNSVDKIYTSAFHRVRNKAIIAVLAYAGLRHAEVVNLQLTDVNFAERRIYIRDSKNSESRIVGMRSKLISYLEEWMIVRARYDYPQLFIKNEHGRAKGGVQWKLSYNAIRNIMDRVSAAVGVHIVPHQLRHWNAYDMIDKGYTYNEVQRNHGHSHASTTMNIYTQTTEEQVAQKVAMM